MSQYWDENLKVWIVENGFPLAHYGRNANTPPEIIGDDFYLAPYQDDQNVFIYGPEFLSAYNASTRTVNRNAYKNAMTSQKLKDYIISGADIVCVVPIDNGTDTSTMKINGKPGKMCIEHFDQHNGVNTSYSFIKGGSVAYKKSWIGPGGVTGEYWEAEDDVLRYHMLNENGEYVRYIDGPFFIDPPYSYVEFDFIEYNPNFRLFNTDAHNLNSIEDFNDYLMEGDDDMQDNWEEPISKMGNGLSHAYKMTQTQMKNFSNWLWELPNLTDISAQLETFNKVMGDPINGVLKLVMIPGDVSINASSTDELIKIGNITAPASENTTGKAIVNEYSTKTFPSLAITEYFHDYRDYTETNLICYLPFVGMVNLDIQDFMDANLEITYRIDCTDGSFEVILSRVKNNNKQIKATYTGNMACTLPVTGSDARSVYESQMRLLGGIGALAGGVGAFGAGVSTGNPMAMKAGAGMIAGGVGALTKAPVGSKESKISSSLSGNVGWTGYMRPFVIIIRGNDAMPADYNEILGYPSKMMGTLNDVTGFTVVESIDFNGSGIPEKYQSQIKSLLAEGVWV